MPNTKREVSYRTIGPDLIYVIVDKRYAGQIEKLKIGYVAGLYGATVDVMQQVTDKLKELNGATGKGRSSKGRNQKAESDTANTKPKRTTLGPKQDAAERSSGGEQVVSKGKEKAPKKNV